MKLEIPIIVGFDDMESLLDDLKKLQTYKLFEGDEMVLVDIEDVAKVLMDHVKAKESVKDDMISRADAIEAVSKGCFEWRGIFEERKRELLALPSAQQNVSDINVGDINKFIDGLVEIFAHIRESHVDDSVCGLCEFDGAYIGESGDWYNECPGFYRDDCFKLRDGIRKQWITEITACMPSAEPEVETQMSLADCISRQDALDAIDRITRTDNWQAAVSMALLDLPSAQPERPEQPESAREYCAECNHIEMCRWYPYEGCEFRSLPSAQPKTGKWIDKSGGIEGAWNYCSVCGEQAIDLYDYCPNCGAKMEDGEGHEAD